SENSGDRQDVADEIEFEIVVDRRVERMRYVDFQQRIAIRCGPDDRFGAYIAAGAWPVLDDELLTEALGKPLPDQTSHDVGNAAGRISDHNTHRPRRIGLRPSHARPP